MRLRVLEEAGVLSFVGPVAAAILLVIPVLVHIVALLVFLELFVDGVRGSSVMQLPLKMKLEPLL